ncbi:DUF7370 family protein [Xenorhabdus innexi]|uniref:Gp11 n=1 Tax=Xenorhabdus innexi TaxID=290109 RepID=A0A1N6N1Y5_9GAMM|nr:hypothetical protein [Xenorhabdus innexi]PHM37187.1 hypothetical protein Xinn_01154 [Xenorhabdus innexi]SIP75032.1 conserved hypothetical protein [Xenorhabdus innexi]
MVVEITLGQVQELLDSMGFEAPDFIINAFITVAKSIDDGLHAAGYPESTVLLIKLYAVVLMLSSADVRKTTSERAPSGASRSYQYFDDGRKQLAHLLSKLDVKGCTEALPINKPLSFVQFGVFRG